MSIRKMNSADIPAVLRIQGEVNLHFKTGTNDNMS